MQTCRVRGDSRPELFVDLLELGRRTLELLELLGRPRPGQVSQAVAPLAVLPETEPEGSKNPPALVQ